MLDRFLKDSALYGGTAILSRGISLLLLPLYTRVLSPGDYGIVDLLAVFAALVHLTVALEITQGVARSYPEARTDADRVACASTALWFTVGAYSLFAVAAAVFAAPVSRAILDASGQRRLFLIALASIWAYGLLYVAQNQLRWELRSRAFALVSLVTALVSIGMSVLLVLVLGLGVLGVVAGQLAGHLVGAMLALALARRSFGFTFDPEWLVEMLRFSLPLVPSSVGVFVMLYVDRIAIRGLMSISDVGLFGIGYRLASVVTLLMVGFQGALTPLVYTHHRRAETPEQIARIFRHFCAFALLGFLGLALFAEEILILFTTEPFYPAAVVVPWLVPALLLSGMYVFAPGLGIARKTGTLATLQLAGAALTSLLTFALIPVWGIRGAAIGNLAGAGVLFGLQMVASQRHYRVPHAWARLAFAAAVTSGLAWTGASLHFAPWPERAAKLGLLAAGAWCIVGLELVELRRAASWLGSRLRRA